MTEFYKTTWELLGRVALDDLQWMYDIGIQYVHEDAQKITIPPAMHNIQSWQYLAPPRIFIVTIKSEHEVLLRLRFGNDLLFISKEFNCLDI